VEVKSRYVNHSLTIGVRRFRRDGRSSTGPWPGTGPWSARPSR